MRFIKPLDTELLDELSEDHQLILMLENGMSEGGFGESIAAHYHQCSKNICVLEAGIPDRFVPHGDPEDLKKELGLTAQDTARRILEKVQP